MRGETLNKIIWSIVAIGFAVWVLSHCKNMNEKDKNFYNLGDDVYAVRFPYAIITNTTLFMAIPQWMAKTMARDAMEAKFAGETEQTAGTKRADAEVFGKMFPAERAILESCLESKSLSDYVMFKIF